jgi:hypothetical protein
MSPFYVDEELNVIDVQPNNDRLQNKNNIASLL